MDMAELVLQGVSKTFAGHVPAVQDLDLTVKDQELVVLVGPSGCGKTTTLRLIAGLDDLDQGVIRINGQRVDRVTPRDRDIAMVFQHAALYPHLTVYENIAFGLRMRQRRSWRLGSPLAWVAQRVTRRERTAVDRSVRQAARSLGVDHLLGRKPRELSGGERQRVALGRSIVRRPAAFLFDEPLSHLDPPQRSKMRRVIKSLKRQLGATIVYVTHDQAEAMSLGDRIAVMRQGCIHQIGTPQEIYEDPSDQFVAQFIGEPPMNMVTGRIELLDDGSAGGVACFVAGAWRLRLRPEVADQWRKLAGRQVICGIRPEHVQVLPGTGPVAKWDKGHRPVPPGSTCSTGETEISIGRQYEESCDADQCDWRATADVISREMLGAVTVVSLAIGRQDPSGHGDSRPELTATLPATAGLDTPAQVVIGVSSARAHWFDAQNGRNLRWAATSTEASR
jgi:multiple sugar transport system ATP-binding protein